MTACRPTLYVCPFFSSCYRQFIPFSSYGECSWICHDDRNWTIPSGGGFCPTVAIKKSWSMHEDVYQLLEGWQIFSQWSPKYQCFNPKLTGGGDFDGRWYLTQLFRHKVLRQCHLWWWSTVDVWEDPRTAWCIGRRRNSSFWNRIFRNYDTNKKKTSRMMAKSNKKPSHQVRDFPLFSGRWPVLGGGFKYFLFSSLFGEDFQFD